MTTAERELVSSALVFSRTGIVALLRAAMHRGGLRRRHHLRRDVDDEIGAWRRVAEAQRK